jgi:hypothetical protein
MEPLDGHRITVRYLVAVQSHIELAGPGAFLDWAGVTPPAARTRGLPDLPRLPVLRPDIDSRYAALPLKSPTVVFSDLLLS